MAKQADGSVVVRYGDTMVLVTAVAVQRRAPGVDFMPLTVEYLEKTSAAGSIPGGYFKREGRLTEVEVLTSRLIDRPSRPLFPKGWRYETQVIAHGHLDRPREPSDVLAMTGASARCTSRTSRGRARTPACASAASTGKFVVNPTFAAAREVRPRPASWPRSRDAIVMVEGGAARAAARTTWSTR